MHSHTSFQSVTAVLPRKQGDSDARPHQLVEGSIPTADMATWMLDVTPNSDLITVNMKAQGVRTPLCSSAHATIAKYYRQVP